MRDVIIVGSGVAGVAAALELAEQGVKPLMLDVGHASTEDAPLAVGNFYEYRRRHDCFDLLIGNRYQGLRNLTNDNSALPPRLLAPGFDFVTRDAEQLCPVRKSNFSPIMSFAKGGLANAWGAGLYRYDDEDLRDFPLRSAELNSYYDKLTREIGISGTADDLAPYFGPDADLQPPLELSANARKLYSRYRSRRRVINRRGVYIGHARVAALSRPKDGRPACSYDNLEFCQSMPFIYSPSITLDRLIAEDRLEYRKGVMVSAFSEDEKEGVRVHAMDINSRELASFNARTLLLAAGTINTAKIVLTSRGDHQTRLPLLDNCALQMPLVLPSSVLQPLDTHTFGLVQLNVVWESEEYGARLQGSILELSAVSRAMLFDKLPLCVRGNLALARYFLPAVLAMQFQFPSSMIGPGTLSLREDGVLDIAGKPNDVDLTKLTGLLGALRKTGAWSHQSLCTRAATGLAMHYAGTFPMRDVPRAYECDRFGRLSGTGRVFLIDGSVFPALPSKNASFTIMANSMRIASHAMERMGGGR